MDSPRIIIVGSTITISHFPNVVLFLQLKKRRGDENEDCLKYIYYCDVKTGLLWKIICEDHSERRCVRYLNKIWRILHKFLNSPFLTRIGFVKAYMKNDYDLFSFMISITKC